MRKLYDPVIPPERDVLRSKWMILALNEGTSRVIRYGEEYIITCACGACWITSYEETLRDARKHLSVCEVNSDAQPVEAS